VRGHVVLMTNFTNDTSSRTINIKYLVINAPSAYNILLGRLALNRLGAVASTRHMKMKLSSLGGGVIIIKSDQKAVKKCYENSLKIKIGVCAVVTQPQEEEKVTHVEIARERRPEPASEDIAEVLAWHLNAFAWSASDMPKIDPDFLCH